MTAKDRTKRRQEEKLKEMEKRSHKKVATKEEKRERGKRKMVDGINKKTRGK